MMEQYKIGTKHELSICHNTDDGRDVVSLSVFDKDNSRGHSFRLDTKPFQDLALLAFQENEEYIEQLKEEILNLTEELEFTVGQVYALQEELYESNV